MGAEDAGGRPKSWKQRGLALVPFAVGLPIAAGVGLYVYVLGTMTPLHPNARDVTSVTHSEPLPRWAFPEHGIVVSVTSNTSYADTFSMAVKVAQAFAEQGTSPARK